METLFSSPAFGLVVSIAAYGVGFWVKKRVRSALASPLAIGTALVILLLALSPVKLEEYQEGGRIISLFIVPATTALALQIYRQWKALKANLLPILAGCLAGSLTAVFSVWGLCRLLRLDEALTASLLPKSVTSAIAIELSAKIGGIPALTVCLVVFTGIVSAVLSPMLVKLFKLRDPVAIGVAIGTSGHAVGTAKAVEMGETEGAMSGIALSLSGVITSLLFLFLPL